MVVVVVVVVVVVEEVLDDGGLDFGLAVAGDDDNDGETAASGNGAQPSKPARSSAAAQPRKRSAAPRSAPLERARWASSWSSCDRRRESCGIERAVTGTGDQCGRAAGGMTPTGFRLGGHDCGGVRSGSGDGRAPRFAACCPEEATATGAGALVS